jgi:hypothetical protein
VLAVDERVGEIGFGLDRGDEFRERAIPANRRRGCHGSSRTRSRTGGASGDDPCGEDRSGDRGIRGAMQASSALSRANRGDAGTRVGTLEDDAFSLQVQYAICGVFDLAYNGHGEPVQIRVISERQAIPARYLEQIFGRLRRSDIVASKRGPGGGYTLARTAATITLREVLEAVEGRSTRASR